MCSSNYRKKIEIFTAGDQDGAEVRALVIEHASPIVWEILVHDLSNTRSARYAQKIGVHVCPTLIVDGCKIFCGKPSAEDLVELGVADKVAVS